MKSRNWLQKLGMTGLAIAISVLFMISPCRSVDVKDVVAKGWPKIIAIGSGTGTFYYIIVAGLGRMTEKYLGVKVAPSRTTGSGNTVELMLANEIQGGIIDPDVGLYCVTGQSDFKGKPAYPVRAWLQSVYIDYDILVRDPQIKTIKDLKGKTVMLYARGSPFHKRMADATLHAYGLKPSDLNALPYDSDSECITSLKTGKIDAFYGGAAFPSGSWVDLMRSDKNVRILHIDNEHMAKITAENPFIVGVTIPGGTYPNMPNDIQVCADRCFNVAHIDLPDSFIYEQTKMVWEHFDEFCGYHPRIRAMYNAKDVKFVNMIYHPGAIKYYKEIGVWGPAEDKRQTELLRQAGVKR
jgi:TRAP transporter TAXI family solute receptor